MATDKIVFFFMYEAYIEILFFSDSKNSVKTVKNNDF